MRAKALLLQLVRHVAVLIVVGFTTAHSVQSNPAVDARLIPIIPLGAGGVEGIVSAMVSDAYGRLYIGGSFSNVCGIRARNVACFDGTNWMALGNGVNGPVETLVIGGISDLYVGGTFTEAGNFHAHGVARWNGAYWLPMGQGMNSPVRSIAVQGNDVFAAGNFTRADGHPANYVARWEGHTWVAMGAGLEALFEHNRTRVNCLAAWSGHLYAGGRFTRPGEPNGRGLAKWDGTRWSSVEMPIPVTPWPGEAVDVVVTAMASAPNGLIVATEYQNTTDYATAHKVLKWDGVNWTVLGQGWPDTIHAVAAVGNDLYAGVSTVWGLPHTAWKWDGQTWNGIETEQGFVNSIAQAGGKVYLGGAFSYGSPLWDSVGLVRLDGTNAVAVREGFVSGGMSTAVSWNDYLAVGGDFSFLLADGSISRGLILWDGQRWLPTDANLDGEVRVMTPVGSSLYLGGEFTRAGGLDATNIVRWNGSQWFRLGNGARQPVHALAPAGTGVYVGTEERYYVQGTNVLLWSSVNQWNGSWTSLGRGPSPGVTTLAFHQNTLYAGSYFDWIYDEEETPFQATNGVARWNGSRWSAVNSNNLTPGFFSIGSDLYDTQDAGGSSQFFLRRYGSGILGERLEWNGIGGIDNFGGDLYISGRFTIGGTRQGRLAKLDGDHWNIIIERFLPGPDGASLIAHHDQMYGFGEGGLYRYHFITNRAPLDMSLETPSGTYVVAEGEQPLTPIGLFRAVNRDREDVHTFSLVAGAGAADNASFYVTPEGALFATQIFDYLTRNTYNIRARVSDDTGRSVEKQFIIQILDVPDGVVISPQPEGKTNRVGQLVCLEVGVFGTLPMSFQWRRNGFPISAGAGSYRLCFPNVQFTDEGIYDVVVCNVVNCVTSTPVLLKVVAPPEFIRQPINVRALEGAPSATFLAEAVGRQPIAYRWHCFGQPLTNSLRVLGADTIQLTIRDVQQADDGMYLLVATNTDGSTSSLPARLEVVLKPRISRDPVGATNEVGRPMSFTAEVWGAEPMVFQWYKGLVPLIPGANPRISGVNTTNLTISFLDSGDSGYYRLSVCNEAGCTDSFPASLVVTYNVFGPGFLSTPVSRTNVVGTTATFTAEVWGTYPITNQWRRNGVNIGPPVIIPNGGTNPLILTLPNVQFTDAGDYTIRVSNPAGSVTNLPVTLTVITPPQITQHPQNRSVAAGATVSFTVVATGSAPLRYEWRRNGTPLVNSGNISGADMASLSIANVQVGDGGNYDVVVRNDAGFAASTVASLMTTGGPTITQQPASMGALAGATVSFNVTATGNAPLTYQWRKGGQPLNNGGGVSGATTATLTLAGVSAGDVGSYDVVVSNPNGMVTSATASLILESAPSITRDPQAAVVAVGERAEFSVTATGTGPLAYQWRKNGVELNNSGRISGANSATLEIANVRDTDAGDYDVVVSNSRGSATSHSARLTVAIPPLVTIFVNGPGVSLLLSGEPGACVQVMRSANANGPWEIAATMLYGSDGTVRFVDGNPPTGQGFYRTTTFPKVRPTILADPASIQIFSGSSTSFTVLAESCPAAVFQWRKDGLPLSDSLRIIWTQSNELHLANAQFGDSGAYDVVVSNPFGAITSQVATLTIVGPPVIAAHPINRTNATGTAVTFVAAATGPGPFTYRWRKNGQALDDTDGISGSQNAQLTWNGVRFDHAGDYDVVVGNGYGAITSQVAVLTVVGPPIVNLQPASPTITFGASAAFTAAAYGTAPLGYQWRRQGIPLIESGQFSGTKTPQLALTTVQFGDAGAYDVVVTNGYGAITSQVAVLTVVGRPVIVAQPVSRTNLLGTTADFIVTVQGTAPLSFRWRKNGMDLSDGSRISGAETAHISLAQAQFSDAGNYEIVIANSYGAVTSQVASLSIVGPPLISSQPASRTNLAGTATMFAVVAGGDAPFTFQWRKSGMPLDNSVRIAGAQSPQLSLVDTVFGDAGDYDAVVMNPFGSITSQVATLTIVGRPVIVMQPVSRTNVFGTVATLTVSAQGTAPLYYQWRKAGVPLAVSMNVTGVFSPALFLSNVAQANAGEYDVVITNAYGTTISTVAMLTVTNPEPSQRISNILATASSDGQFGRYASNTLNGVKLDGNFWMTTGAQPWDRDPAITFDLLGVYRLENFLFWNSHAPEYGVKRMQVQYSVDGTNYQTLENLTMAPGTNSEQPSGNRSLQFIEARFVRFDILENYAGTIFPFTGVPSVDWQVAIDEVEFYGSFLAPAAPAITVQPVGITNCLAGIPIKLNGAATGTPPLAYQWWLEGSPVAGATNQTLTSTAITPAQAGRYKLIVSNAGGEAVSVPALVTVVANAHTVTVPSDGLLTYLPLNNNTNDASGNGRHARDLGTAVARDRFGVLGGANAQFFPQRLQVPGIDPDDYTNGFSFGCWVVVTSEQASYPMLWLLDGVPGTSVFLQLGAAGTATFACGGPQRIVANVNASIGQWNHWVITHGAAVDRLYVNGGLVGEWPAQSLQNNAPLLELGWDFRGALDDVTLFSRELTSAEVQSLAAP